ncbi:iron-containing alcohol dehydrogenase [Amycolatopsis sp. K13G38]|uniref:Iron-containing alcohol dehydrogenase n=1 Tax=Amycolatopsis acididurans TaxID=2724524 RepID=A0ABX1JFT9_9PSEU|nr:iron-containing alcohol dehydrogenase [Amycolatopsis acididurans]NKQ58478.1 iron-containing alcohol dehydrogenase [Amycolatopsis acididurans]
MADLTRLSVELSGRTEFGPGVVADLPAHVAALGRSRAFVVTDRALRPTGIVDRVEGLLSDIEHATYEDVGPNPPMTELERGAARLREFGTCAVIALGGGSALDAAKGISLLAAAPAESGWAPLIAVPTTAGTGAETNGFGVVEDTRTRRKVYIGHSSVRPRIAVLDPELTLGLPPSVTAASGFDALVHGIESLSSRGSSPLSAAYATQAITMVGEALPAVHRDGSDLESRARMMFGAHLAGHALTLSGLGLVHGIGHALTAHAGIPHGVALATVLEEVMALGAGDAAGAYESVARALRATPTGDWASAAIEAVRGISGALAIKRRLRDLGVAREQLPAVAADAIADAVTRNAPKTPTEAETRALLESVY